MNIGTLRRGTRVSFCGRKFKAFGEERVSIELVLLRTPAKATRCRRKEGRRRHRLEVGGPPRLGRKVRMWVDRGRRRMRGSRVYRLWYVILALLALLVL